MSYAVRLRGTVLGHSDLELTDPSTRVAAGTFRPTAEYRAVQPVFRLFAESAGETAAAPTDEEKLARYYAARDALGMELVDAAGRVVATRTIHIADYSVEQGAEAMELEVVVTDARFWSRAGVPE